ncbi:MAG: peptidoglycan-associated lipoprotein Pal [Verrucomicrobiales bacterium]|nr:peptidoglycan-associated lipoprotein Pal [Verrucomicrobiales bacterium]
MTAVLLSGAVGCSKKPKNLTPLPTGRSAAPAPTDTVPIDRTTSGTGRLGAGGSGVTPTDFGGAKGGDASFDPTLSNLNPADKKQDRTRFASDTIYFDFDKSNVKAQYASNLSAVADYLKGHPTESLLIEGNCDERGTPEYNRALGERRALAVREKLLALGVNTDQLATVSFGEEKPAELGTTEAAYAKNRRAEFVLLLGPEASR